MPFLQLAFEDLLARGAARERLAAFLGVPYRSAWNEAPARRIDHYRWEPTHTINRFEVHKHPEIVALAERFGATSTTFRHRTFRIVQRSPGSDEPVVSSDARLPMPVASSNARSPVALR